MEIEDLHTFVEVADAGGVSPAARRLGVSKSIVSRRLVRLEADLGIQLLARTTRGAALTEAGTVFREHAARICTEMDIARETILPAGDLRELIARVASTDAGPKLRRKAARGVLRPPSNRISARARVPRRRLKP